MRNATILVLISLFFGACATDDISPTDAAELTAEAFLESLDQGNYQAHWTDASPLLRDMVGQDDWANNLKSTRQPLGNVDHRELATVEFYDSLEEMPDGEYALLTFESSFSENPAIQEIVGLARDADSRWRVMGYYVH